jgi:stearoyl-CoA desaturase (delta-9 desaturase)
MTKTQRNANLIAVVLPFLAFLFAVLQLWGHGVEASDLLVAGGMYLATGLGIPVGFHRLLTHRSFQTPGPVQWLLAALGSMAVQGPVISWVADHRKHHAHTDREDDPHSPHAGHGSGLRGLWHAHVGWLLHSQGRAEARRYARDLLEDPALRRINRSFELLVAAGLLLPFGLGVLIHGGFSGGLEMLLWAGLVRIFFLHHVTWSINSVCHFFGRRRFDVDDLSTNVFWLALPSLGEAWHHNHHAFPRSARHGLRWWEIDISGALISLMEQVGLASNVVRIAPDRQAQKALAAHGG